MMSIKIVSVGFCVLPWMIASANADVLDQVRMASTGPFNFTVAPASPLPATPQEPVKAAGLDALALTGFADQFARQEGTFAIGQHPADAWHCGQTSKWMNGGREQPHRRNRHP